MAIKKVGQNNKLTFMINKIVLRLIRCINDISKNKEVDLDPYLIPRALSLWLVFLSLSREVNGLVMVLIAEVDESGSDKL